MYDFSLNFFIRIVERKYADNYTKHLEVNSQPKLGLTKGTNLMQQL